MLNDFHPTKESKGLNGQFLINKSWQKAEGVIREAVDEVKKGGKENQLVLNKKRGILISWSKSIVNK